MEALSRPDFFTQQELDLLPSVGLQVPKSSSDVRAILAALVLGSVIEVSMTDGATTTGEFEVVEELIEHLEDEFELASRERLQEIGTEMGMVPFIEGQWSREQFRQARMLLAIALDRLDEENAHKLRGVIAKYCYEVAKASGGLLKITNISDQEEHILQEIARTLRLETTAEGLHLISRTKS